MALAWTVDMTLESAPPAPDPETALAAAARHGDRDAFSQLVRQHQRWVFRLVGRFFRQPQDVEDLAQETFLTAWKKIGTYKAKAPFEHWLTRVCLNCCYARLRQRGAGQWPGPETRDHSLAEASLAAPATDPVASLDVQRLLATLKPVDRFLLLLLHGEGWSVEEIAQRLGWSRANVKVRAHRVRRKLRRLLEAR